MKTMFCIENLGFSQKNYELFLQINKIVEKSIEEISICPLNITNKATHVNTAVYNIGELSTYKDGLLIVTRIKDVEKIKSIATNSIKVLYLYDLDWMFDKMKYDEIYTALTHPDLKIIVRSADYIKPLKNLCGVVPVGILEKLELEKLWNLL